jgi:hypothetical protein
MEAMSEQMVSWRGNFWINVQQKCLAKIFTKFRIRFSNSHTFFWESIDFNSLMMLLELDQFSYIYIYIYIFGLVRTDRVIKFLIFRNSPSSQIEWFLHIQQQLIFTTWLLKFPLIKINFNNLITSSHENTSTMWEE